MSTAVYIQTRVPSKAVSGGVPFELFYKEEPRLQDVKVFGCPAFVHIDAARRLKMQDKAAEGVFVGYDDESPCYLVWFPKQRRLLRSRDVVVQRVLARRDCDAQG